MKEKNTEKKSHKVSSTDSKPSKKHIYGSTRSATTRLDSLPERKKRAAAVIKLLNKRYEEPETLLHARSPWELLVATVLAAQCTDARVNMITPALFERFPNVGDFANAEQEEVEHYVKSTGFYHNKAKNIIAAAKVITEKFNGEVPHTMQELVALPGLGRKTANCVLCGAFGINEGIAVDTHVKRISLRLGLTIAEDPVAIEKDLLEVFDKSEWGNVNHKMVWFGRHVCTARNPLCQECELATLCPFIKEEGKNTAQEK